MFIYITIFFTCFQAWKQFEAQSLITRIDSTMKHSPLDLETITRVISVALACVHYKAAKRPKMHEVISMLLGNMPINDFSTCFEFGDAIGDDSSTLGGTSDTTSSFWKKEKIDMDKCSLLNNTSAFEIEEDV